MDARQVLSHLQCTVNNSSDVEVAAGGVSRAGGTAKHWVCCWSRLGATVVGGRDAARLQSEGEWRGCVGGKIRKRYESSSTETPLVRRGTHQ